MEVLRPSATTKNQIFSGVSAFSFTPSLATLHNKTRYTFQKAPFKPFQNALFATNLRLPNCKISRITARLGRPPKRRNSLREKLTHDSQVRENPPKIVDQIHHFVDNEASESKLDGTGLEQGSGVMGTQEIDSASIDLEDSNRSGESILWAKLDSWVEQYKKDIEFWGIGSGPIFTVFRDSSGNVERVLVDEDEVLRRTGVEPLYYREGRELEDLEEVKSKIAHAAFLAKEMESGKDVIPKNSSVMKFVSNSETSGFVSRIRSISLPPNLLPKLSRVSIAVACGFLFVWAVKRLFTFARGETEMTRFEKEMMTRKIKARMEEEKLQKGSVEVVEEPSQQSDEFRERPHLDKEKLLNSIRKAKGLNNELPMLNVAGARDVASANMEAKIQEIQIMARHAQRIEREEHTDIKEDESDKQSLNELPKMEDLAEVAMDSVSGDALEMQASNKLPATKKGAVQGQPEGHVNVVDVDGSLTKPRLVNGIANTEYLGDKKPESDGNSFTSDKVLEGNDDLEPQSSSSGRIVVDDNSSIDKLTDNHNNSQLPASTDRVMSSEVSTSQQRSPNKVPVRRKPKIILSVREAREYLSKKRDQKPEVSDVPCSITVENERMNNHTGQRLEENGKDPESSSLNGASDSVLAANVSEFYGMKENGYLSTDINGVNKGAHIKLVQNRPSELQGTEGPSMDTKLNLDDIVKTDGMFKHRNASETSDIVPGGSVFPNASLMEKDYLPSEEIPERADMLDELPSPSNLGEVSNHVPDKNAYHDAGNSSEATDICAENVTHDVDMEERASFQTEKNSGQADEINEMFRPSNASEASIPVADGTELHDLSSEKNTFLQIGISGDEALRKNNGESKLLTVETSNDSEVGRGNKGGALGADKENWLEKNFHEVEPLMKKLGAGFRNNYMVARQKLNNEMDVGFDFVKLRSMKDDTELEWMQDDKLREIVFRVRDNELAGRDPFHSMDPEDKAAFFEGLERKVEKENEKLAVLHEWLHSNIENIDYGADGISLYDPPEKIIPRWKGPPIDKIREVFSNAAGQHEASFLQKEDKSPTHDNKQISEEASITKSRPKNKLPKASKTVIEASDGSIKPGKKSGKEFWQHTKKFSPGFLEAYNAQTDPEVKSVMKDIGKDLDRWITEKEIQEAADLMDKLPQMGKEIVEKKLSKFRREMELFGPAAVVSKYREYSEDKEEDYLWWLDLPYVLCIELYTYEGEEQKVGFYSLEMAEDLDINPKPNHVIAFEDPGDCKNLCYIIQAHLEMLGKGQAFVVAQTPKDAFRLAKADGFGVTVIRKGELQLNIDQHLEEVEELITEIGSKMYHDKLMKERSVDTSALMKGVLGVSGPSKRGSKNRALKRP
ncbi:hypothetical protein Cgig2_030379 [Carnegiea gigantea]|uniref:Embryo defective 1703 n=1 Tax=Carnegiea gigantea TaxID=171969 RepID=A0A9Q1QLR6_9CARY|nr:hypothetical protein Cgig2_030379 [Carnegiea gigantea]